MSKTKKEVVELPHRIIISSRTYDNKELSFRVEVEYNGKVIETSNITKNVILPIKVLYNIIKRCILDYMYSKLKKQEIDYENN